MISGVEFSDSPLAYNTQRSSQQVPSLMPIPHLAHPPTQLLPSFFFFFSFSGSEISSEKGMHFIGPVWFCKSPITSAWWTGLGIAQGTSCCQYHAS